MTCTRIPLVKSLQITRQIYFGLVMMLAAFVYSPAQAQELDGAALQELALRGTWVAAEHRTRGSNWTWNEDKTVCVRQGDTEGKCWDTGTWAINENVICYEFTFWGADERKACFTAQALGDGRYETLYYGITMVSTFFEFTVLE